MVQENGREEQSARGCRRTLSRFATVFAALMLVPLTGCLGVGEAGPAGASSTQGAPMAMTAATQALEAQGYMDPYLDVEPTGVVHEYDFWVDEEFRHNPWGDREFIGFAFSTDPDEPGTVPGPEIRVTQGDTVRVNLHARGGLFMGHTMHWHGVDLPWESDGVPYLTQEVPKQGEESVFTYEFVAKQPGTYWYHCVMEFPAHIDHGMFGMLIVEPQDPQADLPFDREQTLIFHEADSQYLAAASWGLHRDANPDRDDLSKNPVDLVDSAKGQARILVDAGGVVVGDQTGVYGTSAGPEDHYPIPTSRYKPNYDTFMINGKSYPNTEPVSIQEGETVRLRLLNAGQLHKSIHLHGHHMLVTHNDGYPLPNPHWEDTINLAPGERIDVYVQGTNPGIWSLHDHAGSSGMGPTVANDYAFPGGMTTHLVYEDWEPPGQPYKPQGDDVAAGEYAVHAPIYQNR